MKIGIKAIGKLDAAGKQVENKAIAVKDDVKRERMRRSWHEAVADLRTIVAKP